MKKLVICLILIFLLTGTAVSVQASDSEYKGLFTAVAGNNGLMAGNYQFSDQFGFQGAFEDRSILKAGVVFQPSERVGFTVGKAFDIYEPKSDIYGRFDYWLPFGTNLKIGGFYESNCHGFDWSNYETALQIQMYENHFLYAGIRGDIGDGAPTYTKFNPDRETALLFLRGDFNWEVKKFKIQIRPLLYVSGYLRNDYTISYSVDKQTDFVVKINDLYSIDTKYQVGFEAKF